MTGYRLHSIMFELRFVCQIGVMTDYRLYIRRFELGCVCQIGVMTGYMLHIIRFELGCVCQIGVMTGYRLYSILFEFRLLSDSCICPICSLKNPASLTLSSFPILEVNKLCLTHPPTPK